LSAQIQKHSAPPLLLKADLVSEMVGEFPELHGSHGALLRTSFKAKNSRRRRLRLKIITSLKAPMIVIPKDPISIAVALADKLDTLNGFLGD